MKKYGLMKHGKIIYTGRYCHVADIMMIRGREAALFSLLGTKTLFVGFKGGLPFEMKQPRYNSETEAAMQEARDIMNGYTSTKSYSSARELFAELDAD